jgi:NADP-dependent 3-hydroxy acid dehydrogenase YdfG
MGIQRKAIVVGAVLASTGLACAGVALAAIAACKKSAHRLRGKVVLITGGSRGLGLAMAEEFGKHGALLALAARDAGELERARTLLLQRGATPSPESVEIFPSDLRKPEEAERLIKEVTARFRASRCSGK